MSEIINIYCDESCHLQHDQKTMMVLGAVWCLKDKVREISKRLRDFKVKHQLPIEFEIKWTKVSPAKKEFYLDILDYFFDDDDLHFNALIVPGKSWLNAIHPDQSLNENYYKIYFEMLKVIIDPQNRYHIYLDFKDTHGREKTEKLHEVLANAQYDFSRTIIERIQIVRSQEVELMQLTDLLIGAISYINRGLSENAGKIAIVERMKKRSGYRLTETTLYKENKVNLIRWQAKELVT